MQKTAFLLCIALGCAWASSSLAATIPAEGDWVDRGVLLDAGPEGSWDVRMEGAISPCTAVKKDGIYYLYYVGADGPRSDDGGPRHRALGVATSTDGVHFTKHPDNPILTFLPNNGEEEGIFSAGATLYDDQVYLYYSALTQTVPSMVCSDGRLAVSDDGIHFEDLGPVGIQHDIGGTWNDEIFPVGVYYDGAEWQVYVIGKGTTAPPWSFGLYHGSDPTALVESASNPLIGDRWITGGGDLVDLGDGNMSLFVVNNAWNEDPPAVEVRTFSASTPSQIGAVQSAYERGWAHSVVFYDPEVDQWFAYYFRRGENLLRVATVGGDTPSQEVTFGDEIEVGAGVRPNIAVDEAGDLHVVYVRDGLARYRLVSGGTVGPEQTISAGSAHWPQVKTSTDGAVHVVWEASTIASSIQYARGYNGVWERIELWGTTRAMMPRVDADSSGRAHIVFWSVTDTPPYGRYVRVTSSPSGLVADPIVGLHSWSGSRNGDVIVDDDDTVHIFSGQIGEIEHLTIDGSTTSATGRNLPKPGGVDKVGEMIDVDMALGDKFVASGVEATIIAGSDVAAFFTRTDGGPNGVLMEHIGHGHGAPAVTAADLVTPGRAYVAFTDPGLRGQLAIIEEDGTVHGPLEYADGDGLQHTGGGLDRYTNGIDAAIGGGVWLAYQDNRSGTWRIYVRNVSLGPPPPNQEPLLADQNVVTFGGVETTINPSVTDPDGPSPYAVTIVREPTFGSVTADADSATYVSEADYVGFDSFDWTIEDGDGAASEPATVWLSVHASLSPGDPTTTTGEEPVWDTLEQDKLVYVDQSYVFESIPDDLVGLPYLRTADSDKLVSDSEYLTFTLDQPATVIIAHDVRITEKPDWLAGWMFRPGQLSGAAGTFSLFERVAEGEVTLGGNGAQNSTSSMYSVIVEPIAVENQAPVAEDGSVSTSTSTPVTCPLYFTDSDGPGPYRFEIVEAPGHGQLVGVDHAPEYQPDAGFVGSDSFRWRVNDGWLDSAPAGFVVNVGVEPSDGGPTDTDDGAVDRSGGEAVGGCSCRGQPSDGLGWLLGLGVWTLLARRRRRLMLPARE